MRKSERPAAQPTELAVWHEDECNANKLNTIQRVKVYSAMHDDTFVHAILKIESNEKGKLTEKERKDMRVKEMEQCGALLRHRLKSEVLCFQLPTTDRSC